METYITTEEKMPASKTCGMAVNQTGTEWRR